MYSSSFLVAGPPNLHWFDHLLYVKSKTLSLEEFCMHVHVVNRVVTPFTRNVFPYLMYASIKGFFYLMSEVIHKQSMKDEIKEVSIGLVLRQKQHSPCSI